MDRTSTATRRGLGRSRARGWLRRARALASGGLLLLAACGTSAPDPSAMAPVRGFAGFAIADEPQAARIGERILSRNGNAADAAVAMAFSLAVTLPSRAGLGGGGVCLVNDPEARSADVIEFLPQSLSSGGVVPATVRGLSLLHARHGSLTWPLLVAPAEQQARFGFSASRALMSDLDTAEGSLARGATQTLFGRAEMTSVEVGDTLTQAQLSTILAGLRQRGASYLYGGEVAQRFVSGSEEMGLAVSAADLRDYRPLTTPPREAEHGDLRIFMPATRASEAVAARLEGRDAPTSEATMDGSDGAGLVVGDRNGRMVACSFTMGAPFGSGRLVPDSGLLMASAESAGGAALTPAILRNRFTSRTVGAASAVGRDGAEVLAEAVVTLDDPRADLQTRLADLRSQPSDGRINLLSCPEGIEEPTSCRAINDPAAHGLAVRAQ